MFSSPLPLISVIVSNKILSPPSNIMIIIIITTTFVYVTIHDLTKIRHQIKKKKGQKKKIITWSSPNPQYGLSNGAFYLACSYSTSLIRVGPGPIIKHVYFVTVQ